MTETETTTTGDYIYIPNYRLQNELSRLVAGLKYAPVASRVWYISQVIRVAALMLSEEVEQ